MYCTRVVCTRNPSARVLVLVRCVYSSQVLSFDGCPSAVRRRLSFYQKLSSTFHRTPNQSLRIDSKRHYIYWLWHTLWLLQQLQVNARQCHGWPVPVCIRCVTVRCNEIIGHGARRLNWGLWWASRSSLIVRRRLHTPLQVHSMTIRYLTSLSSGQLWLAEATTDECYVQMNSHTHARMHARTHARPKIMLSCATYAKYM